MTEQRHKPPKMHVLVVEDDTDVRHLVVHSLEQQRLRVTAVGTVTAALAVLHATTFDIAILDLTLPDGSGLDLLPLLEGDGPPMHVIVLSGAGGEVDRVRALTLGADDYVVKPFFARELVARVLAVGRRHDTAGAGTLDYARLTIDLGAREAAIDDAPVALTAKEFDLLAFFGANPGQAFTRDDLLHSVWESAADWQQASTVTEHVRRLRMKIEEDPARPRLLQTVRGVGYRLVPPSSHNN